LVAVDIVIIWIEKEERRTWFWW